jgi:exodeoxyribonuclease VII small subunit
MPPNELTFEEALQNLERIVQRLEEGKLTLDEALQEYEAGVALVRRCQGLLSNAQARVQRLLGVDEQGDAVLEPLPTPATTEPGP